MPLTILVDGDNHICSDWYALKKDGDPRDAPKVMFARLAAMAERWHPDKLCVCWDSDRNFRKKIDPEYKAGREEKEESLKWALTEARNMCEHVGIGCLRMDWFEADDLIGSIASQEPGMVLISSGDKDMRQLLEVGRVSILRSFRSSYGTRTAEFVTHGAVVGEIGEIPFVDWLAICGDKVDNILGADGFGLKRASKLLKEYGTLESALGRDEWVESGKPMSEKLSSSLREFKTRWRTVLKLVTIRRDVEIGSVDMACPDRINWMG